MVSARTAVCAAALLSSASLVAGAGQAIVQNQCDFPVYLWSVSDTPGPMQVLAPNGGSYSENFRINPDGGGISLKLASVSNDGAAITQFEYTLTNLIYYDISNINGYPFMQWGMNLIPSDSSCRSLVCAPGVQQCKAAYNTPDENYATAGCTNTDTNLVAVLCSGASGNAPAPSASQIASAAVANKEIPAATSAPVAPAPSPAPPATTLVTSVAPAASALTYVLEGDSGLVFGDVKKAKAKRGHRHHFHHHARS